MNLRILAAELLFLFAITAGWNWTLGAEICMVRDGTPQATIVVPEKRSEVFARAACELQQYVLKISGATLPIQESTVPVAGNVIRLGTGTVDTIRPTTQEVGLDGFVIKTGKNKVIVAGRNDKGVLNGVYWLLEKLGCRFYMPGAIGEVVPSEKTVLIPELNVISKPRLVFRGIWGYPAVNGEVQWDERTFMGGPAMEMQHIYDYVVPVDKYFTTHPEYFREITEPGTGKKRRVSTGQRCISNPEVIKLFVEWCNSFFDKNPAALSCSISTNDMGNSSCQCDVCKSWDGPNGNLGNRYLRFANMVAEEVAKKHPNKYVAYLAQYLTEIAVPEGMKARDNVLPVIVNTSYFPHAVTDNNPWCNNFRANFERWPRIARQIGIYDWFSPFRSSLHSTSGPDMDYYLKFPVIGFLGERTDWFFPTNIALYITARMMWDANFDYQAALEEFYVRFYGPAVGPMKAYYDTMAQGARDFLNGLRPGNFKPLGTYVQELSLSVPPGMHFNSPKLRARLSELLAKAAALAVDEPHRTRVRMTMQAQEAMNLYVEALIEFDGWKKSPSAESAKQARQSIRKAVDCLRSIESDIVMKVLPYIQELKNMLVRVENEGVAANTDFPSAAAQAGWDDATTFGGLWTDYEEVLALPKIWKFREDPKDQGVEGQWFLSGHDDRDWQNIAVGEFWDSQLGGRYLGYAWYRVRFKAPDCAADRKMYLAFGAVHESAWVYLNGKEAGVHEEGPDGWDKRFLIDVTATVEPGRENLLAVRVFNLMEAGGIWKSVKLITPKQK